MDNWGLGLIFIFSILTILKFIFIFVKSLLTTPPEPLILTREEQIFYGLFFSYFLTYLIF